MNLSYFIVKHKPTLLTGLGLVGLGVTAIISFLSGMKAEKILSENPEASTVNKIKRIAIPCILPVLGACIGTGTAIAKADTLHLRRENALNIVSVRDNEKYRTLLSAVASAAGTTAAELVADKSSEQAEDGKSMFYEPWSGTWFASTLQDILDAEYNLNRNFTLRGYISMKEVYAFFGIPNVDDKEGDYIGWSYDNGIDDGYSWVDFVNKKKIDTDGDEYYIIEYPFAPRYLWPSE